MTADKTRSQSCKDGFMKVGGCRFRISKKRGFLVCSYTATCLGTGTADAESLCWCKGERRSSGKRYPSRLFIYTPGNHL